jgi:hypothetical protein
MNDPRFNVKVIIVRPEAQVIAEVRVRDSINGYAKVLQTSFTNYFKDNPGLPKPAIDVGNSRIIVTRKAGSSRTLEEGQIRKMLTSMGIGEITIVKEAKRVPQQMTRQDRGPRRPARAR